MIKSCQNADHQLSPPSIIGTIDDWNNRSQLRKYYKLTDSDILYEIPFPDKLFFYFTEYIKETGFESNYVSHIPDEVRSNLKKYGMFEFPVSRMNNVDMIDRFNGKIYRIILSTDIFYTAGHLQQFIFIVINNSIGNMSDIYKYIEHITKYGIAKNIGKKTFVYSVASNTPFDVNWNLVGNIKNRSLDTIYINQLIKDEILNDIQKFLSDECQSFFDKTGIPYKRCFLLYGLPGTGKTSLVRSLASHFEKNIAILKLKSSSLDDQQLYKLAQTIPPDSILLIEDLDTTFSGQYGSDCKDTTTFNNMVNRVTLSGILDLLDGMNSYEKQLIFITCNNVKVFNNMFMRAGRIDRIYEFKPLNIETAKKMLLNFIDNIPNSTLDEMATFIDDYGKMVPVELQTVLLENGNDLNKIHNQLSKLTQEIKNRYQNLGNKCQDLFNNYYSGLYGYGDSYGMGYL